MVGDDESRSKQGVKVLLDTIGVIILGAFQRGDDLYFIATNPTALF